MDQFINNLGIESLSSGKGDKIKKRLMYRSRLIENGYITIEKIDISRRLTFTEEDIITNYVEINKLLELLEKKVIDFDRLKIIVRESRQDIKKIHLKLTGIINIEEHGLINKVLIMSILGIGVDK